MMHGVHAQRIARSSADVLLGLGFIDLDFIAGNYYVNGLAAGPATVFADWVSQTVDGSGLYLDNGVTPVSFQGDALSAIVAQSEFTVMVQYLGWLFYPYVANYTAGGNFSIVDYGSDVQEAADLWNSFRNPRTFETTYPNAGPHRIAITRTFNRVAISTNGSAVGENTGTEIDPWLVNEAALGGYPGDEVSSFPDVYIQQFLLLEPQNDSMLQALSTL